MFDIGFAELLLIGIVGLLVIGPERLPGAIRTTMVWVNRFRRSFNEVRAEVERELHNDAVMRELRDNAKQLSQELNEASEPVRVPLEQAQTELQESLEQLQITESPQPSTSDDTVKRTQPTDKRSVTDD
mgnify:CR=1 FL=1